MKFLVTGGAGFVGSNIVEELVKRGDEVRVLDNFYTGKRENLAPFIGQIDLIEGDIRDLPLLRKMMEGVDFVLHQAAFVSVPQSVEEPVLTNAVNVTGTLNVYLAAKEAGVKRVVLASSSAVYGDVGPYPQKESSLPHPVSPYAASKLAGEHYAKVFTAAMELEVVSLRYFNVYGPRQDPKSQYASVFPAFICRMAEGQQPEVHGDGKQSRDFIYVSDVVRANLLASGAPDVAGEVFNIASGTAITVLKLVKEVNKVLGKDLSPIFKPKRAGDVRKTLADIDKARKFLGFEPEIDMKTGLSRTAAWFLR